MGGGQGCCKTPAVHNKAKNYSIRAMHVAEVEKPWWLSLSFFNCKTNIMIPGSLTWWGGGGEGSSEIKYVKVLDKTCQVQY